MANLLEQIKSFEPTYLSERAETIEQEDDTFVVTTNKGTKHHAPVVAIAGELGSLNQRPLLENLEKFEDHGVDYIIRDPEIYRKSMLLLLEEVTLH